MTDYKPGTVALADVNSVDDVRVLRVERIGRNDFAWATPTGYIASDREVRNVRPLVVLDLSVTRGSDPVAALISDLRDCNWAVLADQIEDQTKPPKPAEPERHGAVVEDRNGHYWTLIAPESGVWMNFGNGSRLWDGIDVARVLSEGVQA